MRAFLCRAPLLAGLLVTLVLFMLDAVRPSLAQESTPLVQIARVDGAITPVMARYVDRAVNRAENDNAALLVIELDTPGGTSDAMDDIVDDILGSRVPVVVYVAPVNARAASAGVYITYAAHIAAMAPSTNIGSASPVMIGSTGSDSSDETMERKVMNDAIARITNLAELRGRNVDWAISAVRDAANITADEALRLGVIDLMAPDLDTLIASVDGRTVTAGGQQVTIQTANARTERIEQGFLGELLLFLSNPTVAYLLVTFGMVALFVEFSNPGVTVPGTLGVVSLILGLVGLGSLPVEWLGLGLMALALVLFVVEIFVPSFGLLTVAALACFLIGSNILIADNAPGALQISRPVIWTVTACFAVSALVLGSFVLRSQLRPPKTGRSGMVGQVGTARTAIDPTGQVLVFGELWQAETTGDPIAPGQAVTVERVSGLRIAVRPATEAEQRDLRGTGDRRTVIPVQ